jgi:hypothetical protein
MKKMIFEAKQAKILLSQSDNQQILTFLKNVGSNFILKDKKLNFALKIGWRQTVRKLQLFLNTIEQKNDKIKVSIN